MLHKINTRAELDKALTEDHVVVYTAPSWCRPCINFAPHYEKTAAAFDLPFLYVDVDEVDVTDLGVQSVPTTRAKFSGQDVDLVGRTVVALSKEVNGHLA